MKCFVIIPKKDCRNKVLDFLSTNQMDYTDYEEENQIYANMNHNIIPDDIATVVDPVKQIGKDWAFWSCENDEWMLGYTTENEARIAFKHYISWCGNFVKALTCN